MTDQGENISKKVEVSHVTAGDSESKSARMMKPQDFEAFIEQAVTDHESALIGYAKTYLYDLDRARDVVQDTYIRLCKQDPGKVEEYLKTWLFTVCRNRCLDILRKDKRIEPLDEIRWKKVAGAEASPDDQAEKEEHLSEVLQFMERLPKNQREVILLKFQQGMSYKEIHKVTGLSEGNIGFLIHSGLKRLREWMPDKVKI